MERKKIILLATVGVAIGATAALLIAPERTKGMRKRIKQVLSQKLDGFLQNVENRLETAYESAVQSQQAKG